MKIVLSILVFSLSGAALAQTERPLRAFEVRWSPDGRWLGVGSTNGIWIFDAEDFEAEPLHYAKDEAAYIVTFDPMRPHAAFAPSEGTQVQVIEIETGDEVFTTPTPADDEFFWEQEPFWSVYYDLGYSDDGQYLSVLNATLLYVLDAETGEQVRQSSFPNMDTGYLTNWKTALDYSNDGDMVLVSDWGGRLLTYEIADATSPEVHQFDFEGSFEFSFYRLETVPGTDLLLIHDARKLYTYNLSSGELETLIYENVLPVYGFDLSPDGELVAVGSESMWVLYDLVGNSTIREFESEFDGSAYGDQIYSLAFAPNGDYVATLQTDGQLKIWDVTTSEVIAQLGEFTGGGSQKWG